MRRDRSPMLQGPQIETNYGAGSSPALLPPDWTVAPLSLSRKDAAPRHPVLEGARSRPCARSERQREEEQEAVQHQHRRYSAQQRREHQHGP